MCAHFSPTRGAEKTRVKDIEVRVKAFKGIIRDLRAEQFWLKNGGSQMEENVS